MLHPWFSRPETQCASEGLYKLKMCFLRKEEKTKIGCVANN